MRIAVTGTPGTGKTTVARLLAGELHYNYVDLNPLLLKDYKLDYDDEQETWEVDAGLASRNLKFSDDCVIDGHISHIFDVDAVVVLRCAPGELAARLTGKGWKLSKIEENLEAEGLNVISDEVWDSPEKRRVVEVDTTRRTPDEVVEEILGYLRDPGRKSPRLDFVEELPVNLKGI